MSHVPRDRISIFLLLNNIMSGEAIMQQKAYRTCIYKTQGPGLAMTFTNQLYGLRKIT